MTKEQQIKEIVYQAVQATKQENSGLISELKNRSQADHDALTKLIGSVDDFKGIVNDRFQDIKADIKELKDGISNRVDILEKEKVDKKEMDEVQQKINNIQKHLNENVDSRLKCVEDWRITRIEQIAQDKNKSYIYFKVALSIGLGLLGLMSWHILGFSLT
jgi:hypothetical protein